MYIFKESCQKDNHSQPEIANLNPKVFILKPYTSFLIDGKINSQPMLVNSVNKNKLIGFT